MSRPGILMEPAGINRSASAAAARAVAIDEVAGAITSVSLAGLEPSTVGRTVGSLERATKLAQRASGITGHQGPALRKRAQLAQLADAGGAGIAIKPWDPLKWANKVRGESLKAYKNLLDDESKIMRELFGARGVYDGRNVYGVRTGRTLAYRRSFKAWEDLRRHYWGERTARNQRLALLRKIDKAIDLNARALAMGKGAWNRLRPPDPNGGESKLARLGKKLGAVSKYAGRAFGSVTSAATSVAKGEPILTTAKRVGVAALADLAAAGVAAAGGAACAAVTIGTAGPGAAACPAIVGVTAAGVGVVVSVGGNHQIDKHTAVPKAETEPPKVNPPKPPARKWPSGQCVPATHGGHR